MPHFFSLSVGGSSPPVCLRQLSLSSCYYNRTDTIDLMLTQGDLPNGSWWELSSLISSWVSLSPHDASFTFRESGDHQSQHLQCSVQLQRNNWNANLKSVRPPDYITTVGCLSKRNIPPSTEFHQKIHLPWLGITLRPSRQKCCLFLAQIIKTVLFMCLLLFCLCVDTPGKG